MESHQQAVLRLLIENRTSLFAFILATTRSLETAEEVFQEMSLAVCENAASFQIGTNFTAWAREIARRRIAAYYRVGKRDKQLITVANLNQIEEGFAAAEAKVTAQERTLALRRCLSRLGPFVRRLFDLRYASRLRLQEVAARVNRQPESVRKAIYRGRMVLRTCIESQSSDEP